MNANWQAWFGRFSSDWCNEVITLAKELPPQMAGIVRHAKNENDNDVRRTIVRWISRDTPKLNELFPILEDLFIAANHNAFGVDVYSLREIQFTEYHDSIQAHYDWHNDVLWGEGRPVHRKLSMVIQLSDPAGYEGGQLELKPFYLSPPPEEELKKQGSVIVFPSFTEHRVTPVTKGTRYSLVAWMEGPKWR